MCVYFSQEEVNHMSYVISKWGQLPAFPQLG